ncbi:MAG: threonine--tRNA ligase [bacterium]
MRKVIGFRHYSVGGPDKDAVSGKSYTGHHFYPLTHKNERKHLHVAVRCLLGPDDDCVKQRITSILRSRATAEDGRQCCSGGYYRTIGRAGVVLYFFAMNSPEESSFKEFLEKMRHSCAHVMAQAVQELFPGTKLAIGPAIEDGFYYDFDSPHHFIPEDLPEIEKRMRAVVKEKHPFKHSEHTRDEALGFFDSRGEKYKVELIKELQDSKVSYYTDSDFTDLCKGPHLEHTGQIKKFKLTSIAGAYWRGNEKNPMLQRIYGIAFESQEQLDAYLRLQEEAAKRDHRKLGTELKLFSVHEECGPGLILWHPKGGAVRRILEEWMHSENQKRGYELVYTPHIARLHLWETSGHTSFYGENMYSPIDVDGQKYQLKPMNCPFHILIYKSELRSYRDLPMRLSEQGTVYRYEKSGVVHGLLRVRGFTQDDAHIFCTREQAAAEIGDCLDFAMCILGTFGFEKYEIELSVRDEAHPENYTGRLEDWSHAQEVLKNVLDARKVPYEVKTGEAAFYGPKIDIKLIDAINRPWQLSTIQFDFNLPEKFQLEYVADCGRKRPLMVHRALFGSLERFFGILIEHYAGAFPLWLSPVQVKILTVTSAEEDCAKKVAAAMSAAGIRTELDLRPEKIGLKIREGAMEKVPYLAIIGKQESSAGTVSFRLRGNKNVMGIALDSAVRELAAEIAEKKLESPYIL